MSSDRYIEELCLAGACHRGISYAGSLQCLEDYKLISRKHLKKVVGVSIGSFVSACYLSGYTPKDLLTLTLESNLSSFKDITLIDNEVAVLKGAVFRKWTVDSLSKYMDPKTTFKEFHEINGIEFTISATCIETGLVHFNYINTPNTSIVDAVTSSMNFPFVFPPYKHQYSKIENDPCENYRYVDGGVLDNFPMYILGKNSLGLKVTFEQINDISSPLSYMGKLFELISERMKILSKSNCGRIIEIQANDFGLLDFDINIDDKITLYKRGYNTVKNSEIILKIIKDRHKEIFKNTFDELNKNKKVKKRNKKEKEKNS